MRRLIYVSVPTEFKEIVVPEPSFVPGRYITSQFVEIFDFIKSRISYKDTPKRIYLTRTNLPVHNKTEFGEDYFEEIFCENGFSVISPENLSLEDQIRYLSGAEEIACVEGTLPHTLIFAADNINVTIIRKRVLINYRQFAINEIKKFNVSYVDAYISLFPVQAGGPFWLVENKNFVKYCEANSFERINFNEHRFRNLLRYLYRGAVSEYRSIRGTGHLMKEKVFDGEWFNKNVKIKELLKFYLPRIFAH